MEDQRDIEVIAVSRSSWSRYRRARSVTVDSDLEERDGDVNKNGKRAGQFRRFAPSPGHVNFATLSVMNAGHRIQSVWSTDYAFDSQTRNSSLDTSSIP